MVLRSMIRKKVRSVYKILFRKLKETGNIGLRRLRRLRLDA